MDDSLRYPALPHDGMGPLVAVGHFRSEPERVAPQRPHHYRLPDCDPPVS